MIEQINNLAANWWGWMWPMFWQVGLLVVLIGLVDLLLRRRVWPQVRYALWLLVLVKLVVPPSLALPTSLTSGFGPLAWGIVQHQPLAEQTETASVDQGVGIVAGPAVNVEAMAGMEPPMAAVQEAMPMDAAAMNPEPRVAADPADAAGAAISWQGYAMLGWLVGVLILTGWLAARFWQLRHGQLARAASGEKPQWFEELLAETAKTLRLGRLPKVVLSPTTVSPAVFGVFRPVLPIPVEDINRLSRIEIEHVLLHELAHIKRVI